MSPNPSLDSEIDATDEFVIADCNGFVLPRTSLYLRIRRRGRGRTQKSEKMKIIFEFQGGKELNVGPDELEALSMFQAKF